MIIIKIIFKNGTKKSIQHQHLRAKTLHYGGVRGKAEAAFARKERDPK
jgi:hypothetical protein